MILELQEKLGIKSEAINHLKTKIGAAQNTLIETNQELLQKVHLLEMTTPNNTSQGPFKINTVQIPENRSNGFDPNPTSHA
jgi:hypothetical protein